jgi:thiol-disulfide isomerase/thioredoxin
MKAFLFSLLAVAAVAGCIGQAGPSGSATAERAEDAGGVSRGVGLDVGFYAPAFQLEDIDKGNFGYNDLNGKPLLIFFTTTWCTPCQLGARNLARYDAETGDGAFNVLVVFVDSREGVEKFRRWKRDFGRPDWYIAPDNGMAANYAVQYLDTKYVLDRDGVIRWKNLEIFPYDTAKSVIGPLL